MLVINLIKVLLILVLFIYVLTRKDKDYLLKVAFLFTFASDVILAIATGAESNISNPEIGGINLLLLGTMVFCFAQLAYFCRHCPYKTLLKIYLPITIIIIATTFILAPEAALIIFAFIYALTEVFNLIFTLKQDRRTALGFALFIACDLTIALGFINIIPGAAADWICWLFYLPAQIILAISPKPVLK